MTTNDPSTSEWHLDKRVPIALILTIILQTTIAGVWIGSIQSRITTLEKWQEKNDKVDARLASLEQGQKMIDQNIDSVSNKIDSIIDRMLDEQQPPGGR